ncbi:bifunctional 2-polyprenyl-6-hydroxyphenol methylase/3-demethylubiquinol 3-O-methyltransferase UbiG [Conexibacter sp. SYSU D00693]|uniref:class I SAM-dependent methyltransferase n=1 Tax=Conexibacter sp. SYSU D00693 TaxID=2812560 RepID=UPI00196B35BF|nr:methyltransferase domain-containing protein [Conexibacter sp. SYSU D00693]
MSTTAMDVRAAVDAVPLWYHTIDLPGGVTTPGAFDLRGLIDKFPWPDVRGKRCLDVGTYDGFLAWELERRGASEVVATDIPNHEDWDWPAGARAQGGAALAKLAGPEKGKGFRTAHEALGSKVQRREISVYHLSPEEVGTFDVVVCGSLMLHLRDPVRALEAIRSVCTGEFMSLEEISLGMTLRHPRRPVAELRFDDELCQWWVVNTAGHRRMVEAAGFEVLRQTRPYVEPYGEAHPKPSKAPGELARTVTRKVTTGDDGVPHAGLLARPRLQAPPVRV